MYEYEKRLITYQLRDIQVGKDQDVDERRELLRLPNFETSEKKL